MTNPIPPKTEGELERFRWALERIVELHPVNSYDLPSAYINSYRIAKEALNVPQESEKCENCGWPKGHDHDNKGCAIYRPTLSASQENQEAGRCPRCDGRCGCHSGAKVEGHCSCPPQPEPSGKWGPESVVGDVYPEDEQGWVEVKLKDLRPEVQASLTGAQRDYIQVPQNVFYETLTMMKMFKASSVKDSPHWKRMVIILGALERLGELGPSSVAAKEVKKP